MTVLVAGIDARTARRGANDFSGAANQVKRDAGGITDEIQEQDESLGRLSGLWTAFAGVIATLGLSALARQFVETADAMTLVQARLRLVTDGTAELSRTQAELFDLAQETRQEFVGLVDVYGRFARSTRDLNLADGELLESTELISKAITVSGATAIEANAALIQMSQGFASGALRGEEFRSVSEQLPFVLTAVADGLGVTRGALREMAFEGQLTAERFFEGLSNSAADIREQFEQMPITVEQATTQMSNSLALFIQRVNESAEVTGFLVEVIDFWRERVEALGTALFPTLNEEIGAVNEELAGTLQAINALNQTDPSFAADLESLTARKNALIEQRTALLALRDAQRETAEAQGDSADAGKAQATAEQQQQETMAARFRATEAQRKAFEELAETTRKLEDSQQSLADQIIDRNLTAQEQYNESLRELESVQDRLTDDQFSREVDRLGDELREADPLFQSIVTRADQFGVAISSAMAEAVVGTLSWSEALDQIAASILQIAINIAIEESIRSIFRGVASSLTSAPGAADLGSGAVGPPVDITGGIGTSPNLASRSAATSSAGRPSFNVSIQNSGAPADVERVEVARADPDQVDMTVFIRAAAQNVSQNGQLGQSIGQSFGLRRQGKQN